MARRSTRRSTGWGRGPLASLDLEATGCEPAHARIVEIALLLFDAHDRRHPASVERLVDPGVPVPPESTAVHGLTTQDCRSRGVTARQALLEVAALLTHLSDSDTPLVMFNARYDWPLLMREARRHAVRIPDDVYLVDAMLLHDRVAPASRRGRSLRSAARTYGIGQRGSHRAAADAETAVGLVRALVRAHPWLGRTPLPRLQAEQRRWFDSWRDAFNAKRSRNGSDERVVGGWPRAPEPMPAAYMASPALSAGAAESGSMSTTSTAVVQPASGSDTVMQNR